MAKKLTSVEQTWSRPLLHDLFESGGLFKHSIRTNERNYISAYRCEDDAKAICDEIKYRAFNFPKLDSVLNHLAASACFAQLHEGEGDGRRKSLTANQIARIIAAFCSEQEIIWDDINTHKTTVEMDTYRLSILGNACYEFECFLSQRVATKTATASAPRSTVAGKGAPKSGYKSSGPKSGLIKGLIGEPGEKITMPASKNMYVIRCHSTKPKSQYVFVDPLAYKADVNKIRIGDPSGWSACKLFFESISDVEKAINMLKSGSFSIPSFVTGFEIKKQSADRNGYFKIATELGPAYIKASKLNEAIAEDLSEAECKKASKYPEIADIDVYNEAFYRYE